MATTTPATDPSTYVLRSFNLLNPQVVADLAHIVNHLIDIRAASIPPGAVVLQTSEEFQSATFDVAKSQSACFTKIAEGFGVSGSFGAYSGSVQVDRTSQHYESATAFTSSSVGVINSGTVYYGGSRDASILTLFSDTFVAALNSVTTLDMARKFVDEHGTHVALSFNLGGCFSIRIDANTSSYADKETLSAKATAAYKAVASIATSVSAAQELASSGSQYNMTQTIVSAGGDSALAAQIDLATGDGLKAWMATCKGHTIYGIASMMSMDELAAAAGLSAQAALLKQYFDLAVLAYSLQNPTIFSAYTPLVPGEGTEVSVVADPYFTFISGGAALPQNVSSWLTNCYPQGSGAGPITGWVAGSHDAFNPASASNHLTAYAIGVLDPGGLLQTTVTQVVGSNTGVGADDVVANVGASDVLTGGGCRIQVGSGSQKFIECSYPMKDPVGVGWQVRSRDYQIAASDVTTTSFAVGISCAGLGIKSHLVSVSTSSPQEHGNASASLGGGYRLAGGGVQLQNESGMGNLVQQTYPSSRQTWTEYNKDSFGNATQSTATAFAIGLKVTIDGLTAQPGFLSSSGN